MLGIHVEREGGQLVVTWQFSRIEIPVADIREVADDDTYGGEDPQAIRIGTPYGTTDRIAIRTGSQTYLLFTTNGTSLLTRIKALADIR